MFYTKCIFINKTQTININKNKAYGNHLIKFVFDKFFFIILLNKMKFFVNFDILLYLLLNPSCLSEKKGILKLIKQ